jgi:C4-dicarboxylate-specific signal transduction histidine kinase
MAASTGAAMKQELAPRSENGGEVILVVEDDAALLTLIEKSLAKQGFRTVGVADGASALRWLEANAPRLMLLDYRLPDMRGEELLDRLDARGQQVPFLVATGYGSETLAVAMMKRGAYDYLVKGATFMKFLPGVVGQALGRVRQAERLADAEDQLRQAHDELEQRVRQRTAELAEANARLRVEIDERRRAEEQLQRRQAELAHVARLSTMGEMAVELAHELNQPLSAISSYAQACRRLLEPDAGDHTEELLASLNQVGEQADRAAEIIRRVRRFVAKAKPLQTPVDVNAVVRDAAELMQFDARSAKAEIRFKLWEPLPPVIADRIQLEQVMVNLMRNAFEAMRNAAPSHRVLTVRTAMGSGDRMLVSVHDTGAGIAPETMPRLFDRFFTTKPDGMGMGLPISQSIIESHGGHLWAEANAGRGATFCFVLPIDRGDESHGQ